MNRLATTPLLAGLLGTLSIARAEDPAQIHDGVLTGPNRITLYTFDKDMPGDGKSMCNGPCSENWQPFPAPAGAAPSGDFSVVTRDDGATQWAYKGKSLYYRVKDKAPDDRTDDGVKGVWHVATPSPRAAQSAPAQRMETLPGALAFGIGVIDPAAQGPIQPFRDHCDRDTR